MLAEDWGHMENRGRSRESVERLRAAVEHAIALDPLLPQAQAALGLVRALDLRWAEAEAAFRRALELDPNLSTARGDFARFVLRPQGKLAEALSQIRRAIELDPLSASRREDLAFALLRANDAEQALQVSRAILAVTPTTALPAS